jgi:hypothetical protein
VAELGNVVLVEDLNALFLLCQLLGIKRRTAWDQRLPIGVGKELVQSRDGSLHRLL